jgi:hypothetical protein
LEFHLPKQEEAQSLDLGLLNYLNFRGYMKKVFFTLVASLLFFLPCSADENFDKQVRIGVLKKIIEKAQKDYPDNYTMQLQQIKWQSEALFEITELKQRVEKL